MGKRFRFRDKTCIYCLAQPSIAQGDHIFARKFFPKDKRNNLPKAPCCVSCNNEKSKLEHYIATVAPFGARHAGALEALENDVPGRLTQNQALHRKLKAGLSKVLSEEAPGEFIETMAVPFDSEQLNTLLAYIVKGLLWHHWQVTLPQGFDAKVFSVVREAEFIFDKLLGHNAKGRVTNDLGGGIFIYEGAQGVDQPALSVWVFSVFGGLKCSGDEREPDAETSKLYAITASNEFLGRLEAALDGKPLPPT